jgi:Polysaccharide deacetylase
MNRKIACITLDIEPDFISDSQRIKLFEDSQLMAQYVSIIAENNVKVTGFVVTSLINEYGAALKKFRDRIPLEYGVHSHDHDNLQPCTVEQIDKAYHTHRDFWGQAPLGYRAPIGLIDKKGINTLMDYEFQYDASIFPSLRIDKHAYSNLNLPIEPFQFVSGDKQLLELPFACLRTLRMVFSMSYVKLFGFGLYRAAMRMFPLPDIVIMDSHPYDFYIPLISHHLKGWKKYAHLRNGKHAFLVFDRILKWLKRAGYEFMFMSELTQYLLTNGDLNKISLEALSR